jgi:hypothetical protein
VNSRLMVLNMDRSRNPGKRGMPCDDTPAGAPGNSPSAQGRGDGDDERLEDAGLVAERPAAGTMRDSASGKHTAPRASSVASTSARHCLCPKAPGGQPGADGGLARRVRPGMKNRAQRRGLEPTATGGISPDAL